MELDELGKLASIASAIGALVGGIISFFVTWGWKVWEKSDRIRVVYGHSRFMETPNQGMHVVNLRDHQIEVVDFGFIHEDGSLISVPARLQDPAEDDPRYPARVSGVNPLPTRNDRYEVSIYLGWRVVGAYARTSTQVRPRMHFRPDTGLLRRILIRLLQMKHSQYC
ncbi:MULTISPECIES: hypothetical protein [unclassified Acidovorax]|uniref:hypothetical protein n=1 Tax=unclassified Acidovorax TaxID=2684926 RepID=UPI002882EC6E|nr:MULTISPECIES: hypothetical protein [unclassified Acidovorax]